MARRGEVVIVYLAGVIQGLALITFPAASAVFIDPGKFGLSGTQYGALFVPQAITAVASSVLGAGLRNRLGSKRIYLLGLIANLLSMALLVVSALVMDRHSLAYGILLAATTSMGIGFGFTVPALNTFAAAFFPERVDKAILVLNALLGLGTALAPVFVAVFVGLGIWWGLPVMAGALILGLLLFSAGLPLTEGEKVHAKDSKPGKIPFPARFWVFASFALLYGVCEAMNGNWASLYLTRDFGASSSLAAAALTVFWGTVTAGRILFAVVEKWFPEELVCRVLPLVLAAAFLTCAWVPKTSPVGGILAFALAGLGCSALLPLAISFGQKELATISASVAGGLIAFYQAGFGLAAFGVGPLQTWVGLDLRTIFGGTAVVALALSVVSFAVTRESPASV